MRHIIACISDDSSRGGGSSLSFDPEVRVEMRACVSKLLQDDAFVIGAVRKPVTWSTSKGTQAENAELPWLQRLKL